MKKIILGLMLVSAISAQAQSNDKAIAYNDYIVNLQNTIGESIVTFNDVMSTDTITAAGIQPYYDAMIENTKNAISKMKDVLPYDGNSDLKNAATDLFQFYLTIFQNEYKEMIGIIFGDAIGDPQLQRMNEILADISAKEAVLDGNFQAAQVAFATKYNFEIIENELQEKIDDY